MYNKQTQEIKCLIRLSLIHNVKYYFSRHSKRQKIVYASYFFRANHLCTLLVRHVYIF